MDKGLDPSLYPVSKDLGIGMLTELPMNCSCPDLRVIHSVADKNGKLKFEREAEISGAMAVYGIAGYLAPFPGYCNSDQVELIEFYSPVLKEYRYDTSNNIYNYYQDYKNYFRPVRVLGYAYYTTSSVWMSGVAPFVKPNLQSPVFKTISVRFDMTRVLTKNGSKSFAISIDLIRTLVDVDGWILTDTVLPGPMSSQNELDNIRELCGQSALQKCSETRDPNTGFYRPINSEIQSMNGKEKVGDCGYFLADVSLCFPQASQFYSYIPKYNNNSVIYGNYNDGENGNSVGYAYPHTFAFLKL
ncbi:Peptidase S1 domain-containing protein [Caenorhabditis elegans]|uniref:Peptidase S1 domain-containing protein n=1 Tax=Caenorhabditis elegans TaxID=6239 RepID=O44679_CAEEL|nr:Peptidase S1 domain-containing protein [Caenorhabditis elegans]CCD64468.1 Peptidase S1 domain-containing protein [Caenorhabditis elegans]|eukprot:NP_503249.1 Uncharacterized protein CELE_C14C6.13 [Caenorhabditis elegans]